MKKEFTPKAVAVGAVECVVFSASSAYVAMSAGALPWPTIFIAISSCAILSKFKSHSLQEASVAQTLASAGALVAGAVAFTLPGIWLLGGGGAKFSAALLSALLAAAFGTLFAAFFRSGLLKKHEFPIGVAAYDAVIASSQGGKGAPRLFASAAFSGVFAVLRDGARLFPAVVQFSLRNSAFPPVRLWLSPMALGIGALIGTRLALVWLFSAVGANFAFVPLFEAFAGKSASLLKENVGLGLMVGFGIGTFVRHSAIAACASARQKILALASRRGAAFFALSAVFLPAALSLPLKTHFAASAVLALGMFFAAFLAGTLTGQTGINPMEVFAILVIALMHAMFSHSAETSILCAMCVAVAAGLSGDAMNDFKSGSLLGTSRRAQIAAEAVGGAIGAAVSVSTLYFMKKNGVQFGSSVLPVPQAAAVSHFAASIEFHAAFFSSVAFGAVLAALNVPAATLGLGVFLPFQISFAIGIGAIFSSAMKKAGKDSSIFASGFLAGEGVAGAFLAISSMARAR